MDSELRPYLAYKNSSVPWLGKVPEHWKLLPNRSLFAEVKDRNHPDEEMLSVTITQGVIRQRSLLADSSKKDSSNLDRSAYKLVCPGDIAYNKMRAWQSAIGSSNVRGIVSPAYVVMRLRDDHNPRYFHELYRTPHFAKEAERWSYGITSDMWSLRPEHFKMIYSALPPREEQDAIVRFLDHANRRIERYIRAKKKLIALLNEQKQAIIHRAVSRGLDRNVRLKPSGIPWLGDVPEHWDVMRLARVIAEGPKNGISPPIDERGTIESFSISAVRDSIVEVRAGDRKYISGNKEALERAYRLLRGDVLLVRGNGNIRLVGKAGVVVHDMPGRVYPDLLMRVRLAPTCLPRYLVVLLNCPIGRDQIETAARTAVGTFKINNQQVRHLCFALPSVPEQQKILDCLAEAVGPITTAAHQAGNEISLFREYRTRLIADVITGKLDVREVVAKLAEEPEAETESIAESTMDEDESSECEEVAGSGAIG
jgi:type I restriction enzyme S subunit